MTFSGRRRTKTRSTLIIIILASLLCYCVGLSVLGVSRIQLPDQRPTKTAEVTETATGTMQVSTVLVSATPSITPTAWPGHGYAFVDAVADLYTIQDLDRYANRHSDKDADNYSIRRYRLRLRIRQCRRQLPLYRPRQRLLYRSPVIPPRRRLRRLDIYLTPYCRKGR